MEASSNIYSATLIGFATGYIISNISMTMLTTIWELPADFSVDWISLTTLIVISFCLVYYGTKICVLYVNSRGINTILKGM
jgi:ABC-type amino acid transport system permease subunit